MTVFDVICSKEFTIVLYRGVLGTEVLLIRAFLFLFNSLGADDRYQRFTPIFCPNHYLLTFMVLLKEISDTTLKHLRFFFFCEIHHFLLKFIVFPPNWNNYELI